MSSTTTKNAKATAGLAIVRSRTYRNFEELQDTLKKIINLHRYLSSLNPLEYIVYQVFTNLASQAAPQHVTVSPLEARTKQAEERMFELMERVKEMRELIRAIEILVPDQQPQIGRDPELTEREIEEINQACAAWWVWCLGTIGSQK